jgi:GNAT superfamily N-acetyltransferase
MTPRLTTRALRPDDWPLVTRLFGDNGACAGCWCMEWRRPRGTRAQDVQGAPNRRALRRLVTAGRVHAVLALLDGEPVGWCCLGPRADFDKLLRSRVMRSELGEAPWAVTCFYIPAARRGRGLAARLLRAAVPLARARGAEALEGYPVRVVGGARYAASFACVGVPRLYQRAGFRDVTPAGQSRPVYRRTLRSSTRKTSYRSRTS